MSAAYRYEPAACSLQLHIWSLRKPVSAYVHQLSTYGVNHSGSWSRVPKVLPVNDGTEYTQTLPTGVTTTVRAVNGGPDRQLLQHASHAHYTRETGPVTGRPYSDIQWGRQTGARKCRSRSQTNCLTAGFLRTAVAVSSINTHDLPERVASRAH